MREKFPEEIERMIDEAVERSVQKVINREIRHEKTSRDKLSDEEKIVAIFGIYGGLTRSHDGQCQKVVKRIDEAINLFPVLRMIYFEKIDRKQIMKEMKISSPDLKRIESESLKQISEIILK